MHDKILNRIKEEYPQGYIIFSPGLVKDLKQILKRHKVPEDMVMQMASRVLHQAHKSDPSIGHKGGRFSHNVNEPF